MLYALTSLKVFNTCQKEWRICKKKCLLSTIANEVKGTVFQENQMGDHKHAYDEQISNFILWWSSTLKSALCVYGKYAKQQKAEKSQLILDPPKFF
jgi:hypothetical protein